MDEQAGAFDRSVGEPSRPELERFFFLDRVDAELVGRRRGTTTGWVRGATRDGAVRGRLPSGPDRRAVGGGGLPGAQLGVADSSVVKLYAEREKTHLEHAWEIRAAYGHRDVADPDAAAGLREFMDGRAWTHAEGPVRGLSRRRGGCGATGCCCPV